MNTVVDYKHIKKIAYSCESGIGASQMGAYIMKNVFEQMNIDVVVEAVPLRKLDNQYDLIITHIGFKPYFDQKEENYNIIYIDNYLDKSICREIGEKIKNAKRT